MMMIRITVVLPFVYTYRDGRERRFDIGEHELDSSMMADPWVMVDFADGRISHINGVPCHQTVGRFPVVDHRPAARRAMEQRSKVGRNPPPSVTAKVYSVGDALPKASPTPRLANEIGSLNLVDKINVIV